MSSPDDHRVSSGKGSTYQSTLNMLAMLLPGSTLSYYGEEIGLLELAPDDNTVATYTSQLGRAVRCDSFFTDARCLVIILGGQCNMVDFTCSSIARSISVSRYLYIHIAAAAVSVIL